MARTTKTNPLSGEPAPGGGVSHSSEVPTVRMMAPGGRRGETAAGADQHTRHDDEEGVEHSDGRVDAAGNPRALRDDDAESDDECPAREPRAPGTADCVHERHEGTDCDDGGDAPHERLRLNKHRDTEHYADHGEEGPRHDPERASELPEIGARQLRRAEPVENRLRSHRSPSRATPRWIRVGKVVISIEHPS